MDKMDNAGDKHLNATVKTMSFGVVWFLLRYPFVLLSVAVFLPLMGEDHYGRYSFFMSFFLIWDVLTQIGNIQIFGRFLPERSGNKAAQAHMLHGMLYSNLLITFFVMGAALVFFGLFKPEGFSLQWLVVLCLLLILGKLQGTLFAFLYGLNRIGLYAVRETMRTVFTFVFVVMCYLVWGLNGALWGLVVNEGVLAVVAAWWTRDYLFTKPTDISLSEFRPLILFGIAFYMPTVLMTVLQRSGNVFVSQLTCSFEEVSFFDIANQFLMLTGVFLVLIMTALLPALALLHVRGASRDVERWQRNVMGYCGMASCLAVNALLWIGGPVLAWWRPGAAEAIWLNALAVAPALVPMLIAQAGLNFAILEKKPRANAWAVFLGFIAMAAVCVWLVPTFKSQGAVWGTVAGYSVVAIVFLLAYRKRLWNSLTSFFVAIAAGVLCVLPMVIIPRYLPLPVSWSSFPIIDSPWISLAMLVGTSAVYLVVLSALRIVSIVDLRLVIAACRKNDKAE